MVQAKKRRLHPHTYVIILLSAGLGALIVGLLLRRSSFPVLEAAGPIAAGQQQLLIKAFVLMLIIVVPVFVLTFWFAFRYREGNKNATYRPNWDHNPFAEGVWWTVPSLLIVALSVMTWRGTFELDPYKPLASQDDTLKVQVVALDWRWLFIYPEERVASINELRLPVGKAVQFDITADAPMNSFWIPQLGGQMYAMPGMGTRLHLQADKAGEYYGSSANISGEGFSKMNFMTIASDEQEFDNWVKETGSNRMLTRDVYEGLAQQSDDDRVQLFGKVQHGLYGDIIGKYHGINHHGDALARSVR
jgi:cytochrome o ubiquinol oxidase subunit II